MSSTAYDDDDDDEYDGDDTKFVPFLQHAQARVWCVNFCSTKSCGSELQWTAVGRSYGVVEN